MSSSVDNKVIAGHKEMIESHLVHLDKNELDDIIARAQALSSLKGNVVEEFDDPDEELFYNALSNRFPGKKYTFKAFKKRHIYRTFHKNFPEVLDFLNRYLPNLTFDEKLVINTVMVDALYDYMKKLKFDLTMKSNVHQMAKIAFVMDRAFPGYAECGLIPILLGLHSK